MAESKRPEKRQRREKAERIFLFSSESVNEGSWRTLPLDAAAAGGSNPVT